jgi:hypothetical protein
MMSSLKIQKATSRALAFVCALSLLAGCGAMLGPQGKGMTRTSGSSSGGSTIGGSAQSRGPGSSTGVNTTYDKTLQQCDLDRARARKVSIACGALFQENFEDLTSACRSKFKDIFNIDCNGLKSRLEAVFTACNPDIKEALAALPDNHPCDIALRSVVK